MSVQEENGKQQSFGGPVIKWRTFRDLAVGPARNDMVQEMSWYRYYITVNYLWSDAFVCLLNNMYAKHEYNHMIVFVLVHK